MQQEALASRERRHVAQQRAKGLGEGSLAARPRATVARDDQGTDDVAILDDDRIDEHTPFDAKDDTGERSKGNLARQLQSNSFADAVERTLGVGANEWFEFEARNRLREIRHHRDDLCTGNNLEESFDNQARLFSRAVQIRVIETSHGESTFADR